jgi:hypothetical protein
MMRTQMLNWRQRCRNRKVGTAVRFQPGLKTVGLCPVRVTNPPRQSGSDFWPGNDPNRTEPPAKKRTAAGLHGPVANTSSWQTVCQELLNLMQRPPICLYSICSHLAEVVVHPCCAGVEWKRKMITRGSGKP